MQLLLQLCFMQKLLVISPTNIWASIGPAQIKFLAIYAPVDLRFLFMSKVPLTGCHGRGFNLRNLRQNNLISLKSYFFTVTPPPLPEDQWCTALVTFASKCPISKQKFKTKFPHPALIAFGHSVVSPRIEPPSPNEIPGCTTLRVAIIPLKHSTPTQAKSF